MDTGMAAHPGHRAAGLPCAAIPVPCHAVHRAYIACGANLWRTPVLHVATHADDTCVATTHVPAVSVCNAPRVTRRHMRSAARPAMHQAVVLQAVNSQHVPLAQSANGLGQAAVDCLTQLQASSTDMDVPGMSNGFEHSTVTPARADARPDHWRQRHSHSEEQYPNYSRSRHGDDALSSWALSANGQDTPQQSLHALAQPAHVLESPWVHPSHWAKTRATAAMPDSRTSHQQQAAAPPARNQHQQQHGQQQQLEQESQRHARKLTSKLQDCNTLQQVAATLRRYAVMRGSLQPEELHELQGSGTALDMPEPALLLQPLNPRHLVVLWCTLARIVNLGDLQLVGVFRAARGEQAGSEQHECSIDSGDSFGVQGAGSRSNLQSGGSGAQGNSWQGPDDSDQQHEDAWGSRGGSGTPLSRVELVALRRLLVKLEQLSWQCMAGSRWQATDAISAMWAMGKIGHVPDASGGRWLNMWLAFTQPALHQLSGRHLANATWALAVSGLVPTGAWLSGAISRALDLAAMDQLTPSGHAVMLWSVARLDVSQPGVRKPNDSRYSSGNGQPAAGTSQGSNTAAQMNAAGNQPGDISGQLKGDSLGEGRVLSTFQLASFLRHAAASLPDMQPHHVSMMIWSLGHLAAAQHPALQPLRTQQHQPHQPPPSEIGTTNGHVRLHSSPSSMQADHSHASHQDAQQLQACMDTLWDASGRLGSQALGPQGTANTLWAAAQLAAYQPMPGASNGSGTGVRVTHDHGAAAVQVLLGDSVAVLPHMNPQQLYNSAWALASMQLAPSQAWVHGLMTTARSQLDSFDMQSLAGLLWACCKLGVKPASAWMAMAMRVVDRNVNNLCPTSTAVLLWSLATLGYNPGMAWSKAFTLATARLLPQTSSQAVSMCLHALARLRLPAHPTWCVAVLACMRQHMQRSAWGRMQPQELSACVQSVARLGLQPDAAWMEAVEHLLMFWAKQQLSSSEHGGAVAGSVGLGSRQLAGCLYGLARLGHVASEPLCEAATNVLILRVQQQLQGQAGTGEGRERAAMALDLVQCCWALAVMGHTPVPAQLRRLTTLSQQLLPYMGHAELAQCVWALQRLGLVAPEPGWVQTLLAVSQQRLIGLPSSSVSHFGVTAGDHFAGQGAAPPLLSVATLLRALVLWGCSAAGSSSPAAAAGRLEAAAEVPYSWLEAAAAVVEAEASRKLYSQEGGLPPAAQLSAGGPTLSASASSRPVVRVVLEPSSLARHIQPSSTAGPMAGSLGMQQPIHRPALAAPTPVSSPHMAHAPVSPDRMPPTSSGLPYAYEAGRLAALSMSDVTISRKAARQRLWRGHRMYVLQHHKVVEASRRALRQLLEGPRAGATAATGPAVEHESATRTSVGISMVTSHMSAAHVQGEPMDASFNQQVACLYPTNRPLANQYSSQGDGSRSASQWGSDTASRTQHIDPCHLPDGLDTECDLRFMPW